ncbi:MAG TPA: hypothetical protein VMT94_02715 [Burkholderiales bacterium]|nr:hypothetical protein [Burkholderiales bacterium]
MKVIFDGFCLLSTLTILLALSAPAFSDPYRSLLITHPKNEATVHDNSGNVRVTVKIAPALRSDRGDWIEILLDGNSVAKLQDTHFPLTGVERGEHTLSARVINGDGTVAITSAPITLYMWQASRLFPSRKAK